MGCNASIGKREELFHDRYELKGRLGQSRRLSDYYTAVLKSSPGLRAAKVIDVQLDDAKLKEAREEAAQWRRLGNHEHCMQLFETFEDSTSFTFVMEHCESTMFDKALLVPQMGEASVFFIMKQMISAIAHVHQAGFAHRDVRLDNFFMCGEAGGTVKLGGFALMVAIPAGDTKLTQACGQASYMSPEMISGSYTEKTDVWSVGVAIYKMLYGRLPYAPIGDKTKETIRKVILEGRPQPDYRMLRKLAKTRTGWSDQVVAIVRALLTRSPDERVSAAAVLEFPFTSNQASGGSMTPVSSIRKNMLDPIEEGEESDEPDSPDSTETGGNTTQCSSELCSRSEYDLASKSSSRRSDAAGAVIVTL